MLLELFRWLGEDIRAFQVFNYLSLRAVLAALTALAIGFMAGPATIRYLRAMKMGQAVRTNGPKTHIVKDGTPTMGGVLILIAIGLSTLLWMDLSNRFVWVVLFVTLGFGWIGWVDDYRKVVHHDPKGMSAKEKFGWQSLIGIIASVYLAFAISAPNDIHVVHMLIGWIESGFPMQMPPHADLIIPFFKHFAYPLGIFGFIALTFIVIVGTSNDEPHMWNMVMLGGEWYHADLTWDDGDNGGIEYYYFAFNDKNLKDYGERTISPELNESRPILEMYSDSNYYPIPAARGTEYSVSNILLY